MNDIPAKIRRLRELHRYTQEYMALSLGISQRAYSKIEAGQTALSLARFREIAKLLHCAPEELMNDAPEHIYLRIPQTNSSTPSAHHPSA